MVFEQAESPNRQTLNGAEFFTFKEFTQAFRNLIEKSDSFFDPKIDKCVQIYIRVDNDETEDFDYYLINFQQKEKE